MFQLVTNQRDPVIVQALGTAFPDATQFDYLGEGSFGVTYALTEPAQRSAIKILKSPFNIARTEREIQCLALVQSPYVSRFLDHGVLRIGNLDSRYFRTEFLNGRSLRQRLQQGPLGSSELVRLLKQLARGLLALQHHGLTHRDLKPENIMLDAQRFVIIDLGFVKMEGAANLTIAGDFVGTLVYAALEQLRDAKHVDIRADLFSLGMIAYESSQGAGQLPFHTGRPTSRADCIQNLLRVPQPNMANLGVLGPIVARLLAIQAYDRTNSPQVLITELGAI